jgi:ribosomal protein L40E
MRNKVGIVLLIIGGIMMIISSTLGSIGVYEFLHEYISGQIPSDLGWVQNILNILIEILRWIANTGGIAVIVGAILIIVKRYGFGKWLIGIGLTFGSLALIIWGISGIVNVTNIITDPVIIGYLDKLKEHFNNNTVFQIVAVTTAIVGRIFVKKPKEEEEEKEEQVEIPEETETTDSVGQKSSEDKYCPNCGSQLPLNANYCNECGSNFEDR